MDVDYIVPGHLGSVTQLLKGHSSYQISTHSSERMSFNMSFNVSLNRIEAVSIVSTCGLTVEIDNASKIDTGTE